MKPEEKASINRFLERIELQKNQRLKEKVAKEEQARREAAAFRPPLFFSKFFQKSPKLQWLHDRLLKRRRKRQRALQALLESEEQEIEKKKLREEEELEARNKKEMKWRIKAVPEEILDVYRSYRSNKPE